MATLQPGEKARMYALGKIARGGATRGGYTSGLTFISIGGIQVGTAPADPTQRVLVASLTISDALDDNPNTCQFTTQGLIPAMGANIVIAQGSVNAGTRLFAGTVLSEEQGYFLDKPLAPKNAFYRVNGIDYVWGLSLHLAIKRYTGWTVGAIARDLVATYCEGITTNSIDPNVDGVLVDEITFTNTAIPDALTQLCNRVGAYWNIDYFKDLHLFFSESATVYPNPTPLTPTHKSLAKFTDTRDLSQMITRAIVEGGGGNAAGDVVAGETIIPLDTVGWYQSAGGVVVSGPQRLPYTGVAPGGQGTLVGPGAGPTGAPTPSATSAAGALGQGTYQYAYTFVTASGESKPSPLGQATTSAVSDPTAAPSSVASIPNYPPSGYGSFFPIGQTIRFAYAYVTDPNANYHLHETLASPPTGYLTTISNGDPLNASNSAPVVFYVPYSSDPRVTYIKFFVDGPTTSGLRYFVQMPNVPSQGGQLLRVTTQGGQIPPSTSDAPFSSNTTGQTAITVTAIAVGQAVVTARKLYRTAVNQTQLKLLITVNDNTTTTYADALADASLGANAPTTDASGLQMPSGSVPVGSTALPVAGAGAFSATGGWAVIGNGQQVIRYTGVAGGALTGIPASGAGAITASVAYNSTASAAPSLIGVSGILYAIKTGDPVNLLVTVDDVVAQNTLKGYIGGTGIKETYIQDRRVSYTEALARGRAALAQRNALSIEVHYSVRERTTSGRTISVNLPAPIGLTGDFKVQDVSIGAFSAVPGQPPTYTVTASSAIYKLEDLLRLARGSVGA